MRNILVLFVTLYSIPCLSQKENQFWIFGRRPQPGADTTYSKNTLVDFSTLPPNAYIQESTIDMSWFNASFSDPTSGELLFLSNGFHIYNAQGNVIAGCDSINYGQLWEDYYIQNLGYPSIASGHFVPISNDSIYFVYQHVELHLVDTIRTHYTKYCLLIEKNDTFSCLENDIIISDGDFAPHNVVRHGNGIDWWLLVPHLRQNKFSKFLISSKGIHWNDDQFIGIDTSLVEGHGLSNFSSDGSKYAYYNNFLGTQIFDFDRCTGQLSNSFHLQSDYYLPGTSISFSPNSRYLYVPRFEAILQYDIWANDIALSVDTVAVWDKHGTIGNGFIGNGFFQCEMGPDDKLYLNAWNGNNCLSVINRPDLRGKACDVRQHGIVTPGQIIGGMPRYINYRLSVLKGSACDPDVE
ncbi:MAG: hypothetical protein KA479_13530 [Saprospiraceae bacterium]|nr:hypothetical protein [Saprospiraceae bacterium]